MSDLIGYCQKHVTTVHTVYMYSQCGTFRRLARNVSATHAMATLVAIPGYGDCCPLAAICSTLMPHMLRGDKASFRRDLSNLCGEVTDEEADHCLVHLAHYWFHGRDQSHLTTPTMSKLTKSLRNRIVDVIQSRPDLMLSFAETQRLRISGVYMHVEPAMVAVASLIGRRVLVNNFLDNNQGGNVDQYDPEVGASSPDIVTASPPILRLHSFLAPDSLTSNPNHFSTEIPPKAVRLADRVDSEAFLATLPPDPFADPLPHSQHVHAGGAHNTVGHAVTSALPASPSPSNTAHCSASLSHDSAITPPANNVPHLATQTTSVHAKKPQAAMGDQPSKERRWMEQAFFTFLKDFHSADENLGHDLDNYQNNTLRPWYADPYIVSHPSLCAVCEAKGCLPPQDTKQEVCIFS